MARSISHESCTGVSEDDSYSYGTRQGRQGKDREMEIRVWWCLPPVVEGFDALVTVLLLRNMTMITFPKEIIELGACLQLQRLNMLSSWKRVWQHGGRYGIGGS